ncbi:MAG: DNA-directed RNA polymerase subunit beta [Candidatus Ancillula sp.]|nr:DNA-directed RNA polymerase subunit beta [Candidatus Ancillula sp.]
MTHQYGVNRISFGKVKEPIELPDLLAVQLESFDWFIGNDAYKERLKKCDKNGINKETGMRIQPISGIREVFDEFSPLEATQGTGANKKSKIALHFGNITAEPPRLSIEECRIKKASYVQEIYVEVELVEETSSGEKAEPKRQMVKMCELPTMTPQGTFIVNGTERVIVSQLVRSPGVYFGEEIKRGSDKKLFNAKIIPSRGSWLEFEIDKNDILSVRIDRKRKTNIIEFLVLLGYRTDKQIQDAFGDTELIMKALEDKSVDQLDYETVVRTIYRRVTQSPVSDFATARGFFENLYYNPRRFNLGKVGRHKISKKLGVSDKTSRILTHEDIVVTIKYISALSTRENLPANEAAELKFGEVELSVDDIDNFANRRVRTTGELVQNVFRTGLSRLQTVVSSRTDFGKTEIVDSEVHQSAVQNIINEVAGISKSSAQRTEKKTGYITPRDVLNNTNIVQSVIRLFFGSSQLSQFMDQNNPLAALTNRRRISALGPGGLSRDRATMEVRDVHTSHYGRVCPIESPEGPNIGLISSLASFARINDYGFIETPYRKVIDGKVTDDVIYLDAAQEAKEIIAQANQKLDKDGRFVEKRVLVRDETGEAGDVSPETVTYMDVSSKQMVSIGTSLIPFLEHDDANRALMGANMQRQAVPLLKTDAPLVGTGSEYRAAIDTGDVILAKEPGIVTEVQGNICRIMQDDGKTGTYYAKKFERANQTTCINQIWKVNEGDRVETGATLADGPATDGGELALGSNVLVAYMNWEGYNYEDAIILSSRLVQEDVLSSIHIEEYEVSAGKTKLGNEEITRDIPNIGEEVLRNLDSDGVIRVGAEVKSGDVLVGKVTPKGERAFRTPEEAILAGIFGDNAKEVRNASLTVPNGIQGTVIGVQELSREKGDIHTDDVDRIIKVYIASKRKISVGDKLAGRHGNKGVISTILPVEDMPFLEDGTPVDVILNPLGVPGRMNIGQVLEVHLGWIAKNGWDISNVTDGDTAWKSEIHENAKKADRDTLVATPVFDGISQEAIRGLLKSVNKTRDDQMLVKENGKAILFDGRSGEPFPEPISVGYMYILKLHHLVDDKIHARAVGRNTIITKQPLGGKAQFGGQRFGEMEVWALEAYGAAHVLHEMMTIKSDDTVGMQRTFSAIVKGDNVPPASIPESFKVLRQELSALALNVDIISDHEGVVNVTDLFDDGVKKVVPKNQFSPIRSNAQAQIVNSSTEKEGK